MNFELDFVDKNEIGESLSEFTIRSSTISLLRISEKHALSQTGGYLVMELTSVWELLRNFKLNLDVIMTNENSQMDGHSVNSIMNITAKIELVSMSKFNEIHFSVGM